MAKPKLDYLHTEFVFRGNLSEDQPTLVHRFSNENWYRVKDGPHKGKIVWPWEVAPVRGSQEVRLQCTEYDESTGQYTDDLELDPLLLEFECPAR